MTITWFQMNDWSSSISQLLDDLRRTAGAHPSRALAMAITKLEECNHRLEDLRVELKLERIDLSRQRIPREADLRHLSMDELDELLELVTRTLVALRAVD